MAFWERHPEKHNRAWRRRRERHYRKHGPSIWDMITAFARFVLELPSVVEQEFSFWLFCVTGGFEGGWLVGSMREAVLAAPNHIRRRMHNRKK